jgi:hypothetical protein
MDSSGKVSLRAGQSNSSMVPMKHSGRTDTLIVLSLKSSSGLSRMRMICRRAFGRSLTTQSPPLNNPLRRLLRRHTSLSPAIGNASAKPRRSRSRAL